MELDSPVASRSIPRFAEIKSETQHADEASSTGEAPSESETLAALVSDLVHNCRQPSSNDSPMTSDHLDGDVTHGNTRFTHSRPITPTMPGSMQHLISRSKELENLVVQNGRKLAEEVNNSRRLWSSYCETHQNYQAKTLQYQKLELDYERLKAESCSARDSFDKARTEFEDMKRFVSDKDGIIHSLRAQITYHADAGRDLLNTNAMLSQSIDSLVQGTDKVAAAGNIRIGYDKQHMECFNLRRENQRLHEDICHLNEELRQGREQHASWRAHTDLVINQRDRAVHQLREKLTVAQQAQLVPNTGRPRGTRFQSGTRRASTRGRARAA